VQRLRCVVVRARAGSIPHGGYEFAPPILPVIVYCIDGLLTSVVIFALIEMID